MELYDSEEQQVEAIKDWWNAYGKIVIICAVIGIGGFLGWHYYDKSKTATHETSSHSYTDVAAKLQSEGLKAEAEAKQFIKTSEVKSYAVLAALELAKVQIDAGKLDDALAQLNWARDNFTDKVLSPVINFRIARIQLEQGKYDAANKSLDNITSEQWTGRVDELRGDIALRKGDKEAAYRAYSEAQQAADASDTLKLKLDDLAK